MIITCEQCQARYLLASLLLGVSGRKVKCGVCGHTWYQEPVDEPFTKESADAATFHDMMDQESLDPIPEGVRPIPEGSNVPVLRDGKKEKKPRSAAGAIAAVVLFLLSAAALLAFRAQVVQQWPAAAYLYERAGLETMVPGDGLIFDQVTAIARPDEDGNSVLTVRGNVVNLRAREAVVPDILLTLRKDGEDGETWRINSNSSTIAAEETVPFTATYDNLPDDAAEVNVRFVLK